MKPSGVAIGAVLGSLAGIAAGTMSITLLYLGMRAVMDVGGTCADGGPFVTAQPCPSGTPLAMLGGMFGLFGAAGLIMWCGSRIGTAATAIVASAGRSCSCRSAGTSSTTGSTRPTARTARSGAG